VALAAAALLLSGTGWAGVMDKAASAVIGPPAISVDREEVVPGSWVVVRVTGVKGPGILRALGRDIRMFAADSGLRALVPVPLGLTSGKQVIAVRVGGLTLKTAFRIAGAPAKPPQMLRDLTLSAKGAAALKSGNAVLGRAFRKTGREALWSFPVHTPLTGRLSSGFGVMRSYGGTAGWPHRGHDLAAPKGTPVAAATGGVVVFSGWLEMYGNAVVIDHGQTVHTAYFHMDSRRVATGDRVEAGRVIGTVGETGFAKGPHLHFGTYMGPVAVDPGEMFTRGLP
jgi:murein DD-endopeptidase MepM/ murein hydrolase activator NlpD